MPLLHCTECHHEWETTSPLSKCDWCGSDGTILEERIPLERMFDISHFTEAHRFKKNKNHHIGKTSNRC